MVTRPQYRENQGVPPPLDESWWEAILAEDEAKSTQAATNKVPVTKEEPAQHARGAVRRATGDLPAVDWTHAQELYEQDQTVSLLVTGCNRGGLLVHSDGLQGFVPISHLVEAPNDSVEPETWLTGYVDRVLRLKIIECEPERGRVVLSERAALAEPGMRNSLMQNINPGDFLQGIVTNVTDFGVFVDLGGVEGLVHVSELSWGRVHHPGDVVKVGQQVSVFVIQVDRERARIALSLKRMHPNPWETAEQRYQPGQVIDAVITSMVPFGAFARLEEGLDGLIHISEINQAHAGQYSETLMEGQAVKVRVLHVDGTRQRLGLSLKLDGDS